MPTKYKLLYFAGKGLAEPIRWLLSYAGEEFEDIRITRDEWISVKPTTPFGKIPTLEFDGKTVSQSVAVSRYLGRQAGLGGDNAWESLQIDIIVDTIGDYRQELSAFVRQQNEQVKAEMKDKFVDETLPFYMNKFDDIVKENNGYLANGKLSWADIYFVAISDVISSFAGLDDALAPYPNLSALKDKITSIPKIKAWIDKRPFSSGEMRSMGIYMGFNASNPELIKGSNLVGIS